MSAQKLRFHSQALHLTSHCQDKRSRQIENSITEMCHIWSMLQFCKSWFVFFNVHWRKEMSFKTKRLNTKKNISFRMLWFKSSNYYVSKVRKQSFLFLFKIKRKGPLFPGLSVTFICYSWKHFPRLSKNHLRNCNLLHKRNITEVMSNTNSTKHCFYVPSKYSPVWIHMLNWCTG